LDLQRFCAAAKRKPPAAKPAAFLLLTHISNSFRRERMTKESMACRLNRKRLANVTISVSSARGLNPSKEESDGIRQALFGLNLAELSGLDNLSFNAKLDAWTLAIQAVLPQEKVDTDTKGWGYARKFVNLYLGEVTRNHVIRQEYRWLSDVATLLEVPLDSNVAEGLKRTGQCSQHSHSARLGQWNRIKHLTKERSHHYQIAAESLASKLGVCRIDLDLYLWRQNEKGCPICQTLKQP
jgi:hypothetical protein